MTERSEIAALWPLIAPWLESALQASPDDFDTLLDVYTNLLKPEYDLWVMDTAAIVSHLTPTPTGTKMHLWLGGGDMQGVQELVALAEELGRQLGCESMTLTGRIGWQRTFLSAQGWKPTMIEMRKRF